MEIVGEVKEEVKEKDEKEKILEEAEEKLKKERTLELSIKEGSASSFMTGAGDAYIAPYALALNANNAQIGFLSSFVSLFGSGAQIVGSRLMYNYSRKKILVIGVFLQACTWLLILSLGVLFWKGIINEWAAIILIFLYCLYSICGNISNPAFFSLMGDLIPEDKRGEYFSKRNKIVGFIALVVTLAASFWLDYTKQLGMVIIGFVALFAIAALGRFISFYFFTKHYDPKTEMKKDSYFGFWAFVKKAPSNNYGKFVIYVALLNLATNFAAPFFAVYMLKNLHYSYTWYIIVILSASVFTIWSMPLWGKLGDKYGNIKVMQIGSILIPLGPFFWLFSGNPIYLIFTAQLAGGLGWAAFNFAASNFIYDSVTPGRRAICVAYFNMVNGIGVFIGAVVGGLFAQYIHISWMNILLLIFLISAVGRGIVILFFFRKIKEVRKVNKADEIHIFNYLYLLMPKPFYDIFRDIGSLINPKSKEKKKEEKN